MATRPLYRQALRRGATLALDEIDNFEARATPIAAREGVEA